mgnify:CR=1 FL=1
MTDIKLINHSSVLIQEENSFILTDPWFEKPAFGSWLPVPPTSVHPAYLTALARSGADFNILISHGHDDHLDDDFLSLFPKNTRIIIPEYTAKGLRSRILRAGFENIIEAPMSGVVCGCFKIKSYINMSISRDDAILSIETPNNFIIHANDNWQEIIGNNLESLKKDANNFNAEKILYMSQCNLADGYPNLYRNYTKEEKEKIHNARVDNIISNSLLNAVNLGAKYFLNYAGYATAFVRDKKELRDKASFKSNSYINKIREENNYDVSVVNMLPGDSFDFATVREQFPGVNLLETVLKEESYNFYEKYNRIKECDSYKQYDILSSKDLEYSLNYFLRGFKDFVELRLERTKFQTDIVGCKVIFSTLDSSVNCEVIVGGSNFFDGREAKFFVDANLLSQIVSGIINWENLYIGYGAEVETTPKDINIRSVVRWMAMYGYFYQRGKNDW